MKTSLLTLLLAGTMIAAPAFAQTSKTVSMKDAKGADVGTVTLTEAGDEMVLIHLDAKNLPAGAHGFHIHQTGDCSDAEFKKAGSHFNPDKDDHGAMHGRDFHAGDLPNIFVNKDGTAKVDIFSDEISISDTKDDGYLLDADGSAFMIHANPDDYKTADTGNAGARIACGVLK